MEIGRGLIENLKELCKALNKYEIQFCLIGGLAVSIVAKPRATEDIDILVLFNADNMNELETLMRKHFDVFQVHPVMDLEDVQIWRFVIQDRFSKEPSMILIDFISADRENYHKTLQNRIFVPVDDVNLPVASLDDLLEMKLTSNRLKDQLDVEILQQAKNDKINEKKS